ncbi:MAG: hypothetical protein ACSHXZ_03465 [Gammaproteobacteria bacterium]
MNTFKRLKRGFMTMSIWAAAVLLGWQHAYGSPWITGNAYDADSDRLLYQEQHYLSTDNPTVSVRVEYINNAEEVMVLKTLDFSRSLYAPIIEQRDLRRSTNIFTRYTPTGIEVGYQNEDKPLRWNSLELSDRLIIDAGFDPYVRRHWAALQAGDAIRGEFLVPARLDTVNISIRAVDAQDCLSQTQTVLCLVVRPAGFLRLVSWFVDPLHLAYDTQTQRLLLYKGISNLLDADGNPQDVVIRYQYH